MPKQSSQRSNHGHRRLETPTESNIDAWLESPDHKPTTGSPMLDDLLKRHGIFDYLRTTVRAQDANVKPLTPPEGCFKKVLVWILTVAGVKAAPHVNVVYHASNYNYKWKIYLIIGWLLVTFLTLPVTKVRNAVGTGGWGEFEINAMCPPPSQELAQEIRKRVERAAHLEEAKEQAKIAAGGKLWADTITTKGKTTKGDLVYPKWPTGCDRNAQERERNAALSQRCTEEVCASLLIDLKCAEVDIPCPKSTTSMDALMRNYQDYQRLKTQDRKPQDTTKRGNSDLLDDKATAEMNKQADIFTKQIRIGSFLFNCFTLIMLLLAPPAPYSTTSTAIKIKRGIGGISKITFILATVLVLQAYAFLKATSFEPILRYIGTPCQFSKEISKIRSNAITDTCKAVIELGQQRVADTYQFEDFQAAVKPYGICDDLSEKWVQWGINDGYPFATTTRGLVIPQNESYNTNWTFDSLKVQLGQEYKGQCNLTTMAKALLEDYPVNLAVEMQLEVGPKLLSLIFQNILPSIFFSWLVVLVYVIHPQASYSGKFEAPPHVFDRSPWLKDAAARDIKRHARLSNILYLILWSGLMVVAAYYIITVPKIHGKSMPSLTDMENEFGSGSGSGSWDGSL